VAQELARQRRTGHFIARINHEFKQFLQFRIKHVRKFSVSTLGNFGSTGNSGDLSQRLIISG
jgi:hypothetical protein